MWCEPWRYPSILHGTPQSMLHPRFWFLATSPNFANLLGPSPPLRRGGAGVAVARQQRAGAWKPQADQDTGLQTTGVPRGAPAGARGAHLLPLRAVVGEQVEPAPDVVVPEAPALGHVRDAEARRGPHDQELVRQGQGAAEAVAGVVAGRGDQVLLRPLALGVPDRRRKGTHGPVSLPLAPSTPHVPPHVLSDLAYLVGAERRAFLFGTFFALFFSGKIQKNSKKIPKKNRKKFKKIKKKFQKIRKKAGKIKKNEKQIQKCREPRNLLCFPTCDRRGVRSDWHHGRSGRLVSGG